MAIFQFARFFFCYQRVPSGNQRWKIPEKNGGKSMDINGGCSSRVESKESLADQKSKDLTELRILPCGYLRYMEAKAHLLMNMMIYLSVMVIFHSWIK